MGYIVLRGVQGVTRGYRGYKGLQGVTRGYTGLQGVPRGYRGLQEVKIQRLWRINLTNTLRQ